MSDSLLSNSDSDGVELIWGWVILLQNLNARNETNFLCVEVRQGFMKSKSCIDTDSTVVRVATDNGQKEVIDYCRR